MESESVTRLNKDILNAAKVLTATEARFLVDAYYIMQRDRIRSANQSRALDEAHEPNSLLKWLTAQSDTLEKQVKRALERYAESSDVGVWSLSQKGIGPVITAGLLSHIDIEKAPTVGHIWRFAGLDPTSVWEKGKRRPHNAALKTLCWKIGESFVKVSGDPEAYYGQVYVQRKAYELAKNELREYAPQAAAILAKHNYRDDTKAKACYLDGRLPPAHIHARAKRYAVKLFLSHLHEVWFVSVKGVKPPAPYPIAYLNHAHYLAPPCVADTSAEPIDQSEPTELKRAP